MIGPLIQRIRCGHGDSLREAAAKVGVDKSVLMRLEGDQPIRNRAAVLHAFGTAYGVDPDELTKEDSASGSFLVRLAAMDEGERASFLGDTFEHRTLGALDWATRPEGAAVDVDRLAGAAGMTRQEINAFRATCRRGRADRATSRRLARALASLLDIPPCWFTGGTVHSEAGVNGWSHLLQIPLDLVRQARPAMAGRQRLAPIRHLHEAIQQL